ncbi:leishmanolysin-related zinc metalloendopeptidase [Jannaschia sp. LMIT008]|uniref:leishmanolysin-related zinc metalloendopeptidase n=1 Tax=Jannaschia maritima TaxID=3032585 RepID=UPI002810E476|nr:leishmanolysin-related zinc metalloendopeptidase [Jannaschia sp. LMIT008]
MKITTIAAVGLLSAGAAGAVPFDLAFNVPDAATDGQRALLAGAESFWESVLVSYRDGLAVDVVVVDVFAREIDGAGGTLASAGPTFVSDQIAADGTPYVLATDGEVEFDIADLDTQSEALLFATLVHEIAHVLGFGTLWEDNGLYVRGSGRYTGAEGVAAYRAEFGAVDSFVPAELDGGPGSIDAHWDDGWLGPDNELMLAEAVDDALVVSRTTVASFRDLGFVTFDQIAPIPLPAGMWLTIGAFGLLAGLRRRR